MPLWTWLADRLEPGRQYARLLHLAFRPPDEKSTARLVQEVERGREKPGLLKRIVGRRTP